MFARNFFYSLAVALCAVSVLDAAQAQKACESLVHDCVVYSSPSRSQCLREASRETSCRGSILGTLAMLRAAVDSERTLTIGVLTTERSASPRANSACLKNFDSVLASTLIFGTPSDDEVRGLARSLQRCSVVSEYNLPQQ